MGNPNRFNRQNYGQGGWLRKVPGFRSDTTWKKVIAIFIYFFLGLMLLVATQEDGIAGFISFLAIVAFFGSIVALIKGNLSSFKIPNRKIAGIVLIISFALAGILLPPPTEEVQEDIGLESSETAQIEKEEKATEEKKKTEEQATEEKQKAEELAAKKAEEERLALEAEEARKAQEAKDAEEARKAEEAKKAEEARLAKEAEEKAKAEAEKAAQAKASAEKKKQELAPNATVTRVVDGDTLEVSMDGRTETVRLLLIDTPETVHPQKSVEPFGPEASKYIKDTLTGQQVRVVVGNEARDNYGRMLAYVYIGNETIQEKLLRHGLAATAYLYNDLTMLDRFHQVQQEAIDAKKGVWSIPGYAHVDHDHGFHYEEAELEPEPAPEPAAPAPAAPAAPAPNTGLQFDPNGPDRDCGDFSSQAAAQAFMEASGSGDPHRLDGNDNDGLACESL